MMRLWKKSASWIVVSLALFVTVSGTASASADKIIVSSAKTVKGEGFSISIPASWSADIRVDQSIVFTIGKDTAAGTMEELGYSKDQTDSSLLPNYGETGKITAVKGLAVPAIQATVTYTPDGASKSVSDLHYILKDADRQLAYDFAFRTANVSAQTALGVVQSFTLEKSFSLTTGKKETVTRTVEGMKEKVSVIPYTVKPYGISFKFDASYGKPAVYTDSQTVSFCKMISKKSCIRVSLQFVDKTKADALTQSLNKEFAAKGYKKMGTVAVKPAGALAGTLVNFASKTSYAGYTLYDLNNGSFLVVRHAYVKDAGDGAGSALNALRSSLKAN